MQFSLYISASILRFLSPFARNKKESSSIAIISITGEKDSVLEETSDDFI